jgi:hypothetical protein
MGAYPEPSRGAVVEEMELGRLVLFAAFLARDENLTDQIADGIDGARHDKMADRVQANIVQASADPLADGPEDRLSRQRFQRRCGKIDHHIVELPHEPLVRPEHDRADRGRSLAPSGFREQRRAPYLAEACAQTQLHGAIVIG